MSKPFSLGSLPRRSRLQRLTALALALWAFGALQLLALPKEAWGDCAMACSLDGGGCCCSLTGFSLANTHDDGAWGRPRLDHRDRACPEAVVTVATVWGTESDRSTAAHGLLATHSDRPTSLIDAGESPGDTRRLSVPRPPPAFVLL